MSDIVERLRATAAPYDGEMYSFAVKTDMLQEAADEIERLRAENARFRSFIDATSDPGDVADWCDEYVEAREELALDPGTLLRGGMMRLTLMLNNDTLIADTMAWQSPTFTDGPDRTVILVMDDDAWARMGKPSSIAIEINPAGT